MFKIEVDINGVKHHDYWMNKHKDDWIRFLPKNLTEIHGEEVTKEMISIYKIDESKKPILTGKENISDFNFMSFSDGRIIIKRFDKAPFIVGEKVSLEDYLELKKKRDEKFKGSKDELKNKVKDPKVTKEDFLDENGDPVLVDGKVVKVDMVLIDNLEDLSKDAESIELELVGELVAWPYKENKIKDKKGKKFLHYDGFEFTGV